MNRGVIIFIVVMVIIILFILAYIIYRERTLPPLKPLSPPSRNPSDPVVGKGYYVKQVNTGIYLNYDSSNNIITTPSNNIWWKINQEVTTELSQTQGVKTSVKQGLTDLKFKGLIDQELRSVSLSPTISQRKMGYLTTGTSAYLSNPNPPKIKWDLVRDSPGSSVYIIRSVSDPLYCLSTIGSDSIVALISNVTDGSNKFQFIRDV